MIIEYTDTARYTTEQGSDWSAKRFFRGKRDTIIVDELWKTILENKDKPFSEMYQILKTAYFLKTCKSRIDIYYGKYFIECTNKGIFPNILIANNNQN